MTARRSGSSGPAIRARRTVDVDSPFYPFRTPAGVLAELRPAAELQVEDVPRRDVLGACLGGGELEPIADVQGLTEVEVR